MADSALYIGWNRPVIGRERLGMELFTSLMSYFQEQVNAENIESFEPVLLNAHGGDMNGFFLVRGEGTKLDTLKRSDRFLTLLTQCEFAVQNMGIIDAHVGTGLTEMLDRYNKIINS